MQVIGLCRFSYLAIGGFQVDFEDMEAKKAYLYDPVRMEERFRTLETITLPSIRAQTDRDFTFLIVSGHAMPGHYKRRLAQLVADIPQAVLHYYSPMKHRIIMRKAINAVRRFDDQPCLQFRLDDDDAVGVDFIARLRSEAGHVRGLLDGRRYLALDFNRGFLVQPGPEGLRVVEHIQPYVTSALALMVAPGEKQTIMNFTHNKVAEVMPTVTFTDEDMLLRGLNAYNDSRQKPGIKAPKMHLLDEEGEAYFRARYGIDNAAIRAAWTDVASNTPG